MRTPATLRGVALSARWAVASLTIVVALFIMTARCAAGVRPSPVIHPEPGQVEIRLGRYATIFEDQSGTLTIDQVSSLPPRLFHPMAHDFMVLMPSRKALWLRFRAELSPQESMWKGPWLLDLGWAYYNALEFYSPGEGGSAKVGSWTVQAFRPSDGLTGFRTITLNTDGLSHEYFLKITTDRMTFLNPVLMESSHGVTSNALRSLGYGAMGATMAVIAIYNLFIFLYIRDKTFLWFVVYVVCFTAYQINFHWLPFVSIPYQQMLSLVALNTGAVCMVLFTREFLNIKKELPRLNKMLAYSAHLLLAAQIAGAIFFDVIQYRALSMILHPVAFIFSFLVTAISAVQGQWSGRILTLAWLVVAIPFLIFLLTALGQTVIGLTTPFYLILSAVLLLMSLLLNYRIRLIKAQGEIAEATSKAKSLFVARVSHEIRTPMTAIMGFTDLALNLPTSEHLRQYHIKIKSAAIHLMNLLNDVLDLAKMEADKLVIENVNIDIETLLRDVCDIAAHRARENKNEIVCFIEPGTPESVTADPMRLKQVLGNLMSNACKFTHNGDIALRVTTPQHHNALPGSGWLRFEVQDTGIGISRNMTERIFEPFEQDRTLQQHRYGGTGLGLSISNKLVHLMGGSIGVTSEPGRGSCFWFTLPAQPAEAPVRTPSGTLPMLSSIPEGLRGMTALVVDDNPLALHALMTALRDHGFAPTGVSSEQDAIVAAQKACETLGFVILDSSMPEMDAPEALLNLRQHGLPASVPVFLMDSSICNAKEMKAWGFAGFIAKPVLPKELLRALLSVLAPNPCTATHSDKEPAQAAPAAGGISGKRVLVADDDGFSLEVSRIMLEQLGGSVDCVDNGMDAFERIARGGDYDLVLMDVHMPIMDGYAACRKIRALGGRFGHLPIIAVTANALKSDREACLVAGMNDFISKPYEANALASCVSHWANYKPDNASEGQANSPAHQGTPIQ